MDIRLFAVLLLVLAISSAHAAIVFQEFRVVAELREDSVLNQRITVKIANTGDAVSSISLPVSQEVTSATAYDEIFNRYSTRILPDSVMVSKELGPGESAILTVTLYSVQQVSRNEENTFVFTQRMPENVSRFELITALPEGYVLSGRGAVPEPTTTTSDGRRILLSWTIEEPDEEFLAVITYSFVGGRDSTVPIFLAALLVLGAVLTLLAYLLFKHKKRETKLLAVGLSSDEKRIFDLVKESKEVKQKELQLKLGISKPRLSKLVRGLAEQGLLEIVPSGRTNIIRLKEIK
jgi:uncharacterized membrane protein